MATLLETQRQAVIAEGRSAKFNPEDSDRSYRELLEDETVGVPRTQYIVDSFVSDPLVGLNVPPITEQEVRATPPTHPEFKPMGAPPGTLEAGEYYEEDGTISYSPEIEAALWTPIILNVGSLARGKKEEDRFIPGAPLRGDDTSIVFELPPGTSPDNIPLWMWDEMVKKAKEENEELFYAAQSGQDLEGVFQTWGRAAGQSVTATPGALADFLHIAARGIDYVISPTGTNALLPTVAESLGIPVGPLREGDFWTEEVPRVGERIGLYRTEAKTTIPFMHTREPGQELSGLTEENIRLVNEALSNMGVPELFTFQQETEMQRVAALFGTVMGGAATEATALLAAAKAVKWGFTAERLAEGNMAQRVLLRIADSPSAEFYMGGRRRFQLPNPVLILGREELAATMAAGAMALVPEEWGPEGMLYAGLGGPLSINRAAALIRRAPFTGPLLTGFLEPFTERGQKAIAIRSLMSAWKGNEAVVAKLLADFDEAPRRPGTGELDSLPAHFDSMSENLLHAASEWENLSLRGMDEQQILRTLLESPDFEATGFQPLLNKLVGTEGIDVDSLAGLQKTQAGIKGVSNELYGYLNFITQHEAVGPYLLGGISTRQKQAEAILEEVGRLFEGADENLPITFINEKVLALDRLLDEALGEHAVSAVIYNELKALREGGATDATRKAASTRAVVALQGALREGRLLESQVWDAIGANGIDIPAEMMQRIGDHAAQIILETPLARRGQIDPLIYQLAGKNRIMSEEQLVQLAQAMGQSPDTPGRIITARAALEGLQSKVDTAQGTVARITERLTTEFKTRRGRNRDDLGLILELTDMPLDQAQAMIRESASQLSKRLKIPMDRATRILAERKGIVGARNQLEKARGAFDSKKATLNSLEKDLMPEIVSDEGHPLVLGPNGLLDNVTKLNEVLELRGELLDRAWVVLPRGKKQQARILEDMQNYIIDDWLQDPDAFGEAGTNPRYDLARKVSKDLNTRYTRGPIKDFQAVAADRGSKIDPEKFLKNLVNESQMGERRVSGAGLSAFDLGLVEAQAPWILREDGKLTVDPNLPLTAGFEDITYERIRNGDTALSAELLREEVINRLAIVAFNNDGKFNAASVTKFLSEDGGFAGAINRLNEDFPGFRRDLEEIANQGDELANRRKALERPTQESIDAALKTMSADDVKGVLRSGVVANKLRQDHGVASLFLRSDVDTYVGKLFENPDRLTQDLDTTLAILRSDDTGAALKGFKRAVWKHLNKAHLMEAPSEIGRASTAIVPDPHKINKFLRNNEVELRKIFDDVVSEQGGETRTTFDLMDIFNQEVLLTIDEYRGQRGPRPRYTVKPEIGLRGQELVRNMGRIVGVWVSGKTGGPSLVMAGAGGRVANTLWQKGGMSAVYRTLGEALLDPSFANDLMIDPNILPDPNRQSWLKRTAKATGPFLFMEPLQWVARRPGTTIEVQEQARERFEEQQRNPPRGPLYYNPDKNVWEEMPLPPRITPSEEPPAPPVNFPSTSPLFPMGGGASLQVPTPRDGTMLSQIDPLAPRQFAAPTSPVDPRQFADTRQRGQQVFGPTDPVFANKGGLASLKKKKKSRQMVY